MEAYAQKMAEEAKRQKEAADMIALLEKEEKDLIGRLKHTQELQQQVSSVYAYLYLS